MQKIKNIKCKISRILKNSSIFEIINLNDESMDYFIEEIIDQKIFSNPLTNFKQKRSVASIPYDASFSR